MSGEFKHFENASPSMFAGPYMQLHEFLDRRQEELLQKGDEARDRIDSLEKLHAHNARMKTAFIEKMGGIPERDCPLNAQITGTVDMGDYTVENIVYCARSGVYVTSSLYLPRGLDAPSAAVLYLSGHTGEARMDVRYQEVCQTLACAGLIVFAIDTAGQGERRNFYDPETNAHAALPGTTDHDCCGVPMVCTGRFIESYFMNDQMSAIDYMLTRPEIDPARIGVTGCSGGGLQSLCMMVCDDRIAAAAPATFTTTRRDIMHTCQSQDSEQIWPGCASYGFDHFEPYLIFAPKPAMMLTVDSDFFPIEGAYEVFETAKKAYALYGKEENLEIYEDHACHGYTQPLAEAAAEFFCRVFGVTQRTPYTLNALPLDQIRCTKTGNIIGTYPDVMTMPDETAALAKALRQNRKTADAKAWLSARVMQNRIPTPARPRIDDHRTEMHVGDHVGRAVMWWVQKNLSAFGVLISSAADADTPPTELVIALWDHGTRAIAAHEDWIKSVCAQNKRVLVVDLPGGGNIEQAFLWGWSSYRDRYGTMYKLCCDLMYMDDSMAAMQTYHLLRTVDMAREVWHFDGVTLYCDGQEGVYGIIAGYLADIARE